MFPEDLLLFALLAADCFSYFFSFSFFHFSSYHHHRYNSITCWHCSYGDIADTPPPPGNTHSQSTAGSISQCQREGIAAHLYQMFAFFPPPFPDFRLHPSFLLSTSTHPSINLSIHRVRYCSMYSHPSRPVPFTPPRVLQGIIKWTPYVRRSSVFLPNSPFYFSSSPDIKCNVTRHSHPNLRRVNTANASRHYLSKEPPCHFTLRHFQS